MIPPPGLVGHLLASEIAYTAARAAVIARWPDNPHGVAMLRHGPVFACRVKGVPSPWLNRVIGLRAGDGALVPDLVAWFAAAAIAGRFELTPDQDDPALARALAAAGLLPSGGDTLVWGAPAPSGAPRHAVEAVSSVEAVEAFLDTHLAGLSIPLAIRDGAKRNMRGWRGQPGWHLLLARRDGEPAGSCVLQVAGDTAYIADMATVPEHRGHGVQTALLAECHRRSAGATHLWARCRFLSQSHRNLIRAGLGTLCTTSFWM